MAENNQGTKDGKEFEQDKQPLVHSLECPVCLSIFTEPKSLTCSHSFCRDCLERLLQGQTNQLKMSCPVCKEVTRIPDGGVARLAGNEALEMQIGAALNQCLVCTICTLQDKEHPEAINYCLDCDHYMCSKCFQRHLDWELFATHVIIPVQDIVSGQTILRTRPKCQKHPKESKECFCIKCRKYMCFRCGVKEHAQMNHKVVEATEHEAFQKKNLKQLKSRADKRREALLGHLHAIREQKERMSGCLLMVNEDIHKAYHEVVQELTNRKEALRQEAKECIVAIETRLSKIEETCQQRIDKVEAANALVGNGLKMPLEKEAINAHDQLVEKLKQLLAEENKDLEDLISENKNVNLSFVEKNGGPGREIGQLLEVKCKWVFKVDVAIAEEKGTNGLAPTADGRMAAGCNPGGLKLCSNKGKLDTKLKDLKISKVDFLSDGRLVIRDPTNEITLYTVDYQKVDVKFFTPHWSEGGEGGLAVGSDDLVYASQCKQEVIQVFRPTGGNPIREIMCSGEKPWQMFAMKYHKMMLIQRTDRYSVGVIDDTGCLRYSVKSGSQEVHACPALYHDDNVLIAWVRYKVGRVDIVQYSHQLELIKPLISNYQFKIPARHAYFLDVFKTGEIAFCSKNHMYIFQQT